MNEKDWRRPEREKVRRSEVKKMWAFGLLRLEVRGLRLEPG